MNSEEVGQFLRGELPLTRRKEMLRHLLSGCDQCAEAVTLLGLGSRTPGMDLEEVADPWTREARENLKRRIMTSAESLASGANESESLCDELLSQTPPHRLMLARNSARFQRLEVVSLLLDEAYGKRFGDPREMLGLAELAYEICGRSTNSRLLPGLNNDLAARCHATLGLAQTVLGNYGVAAQCFSSAEVRLQEGTADPLELARLLSYRFALLYRTQQLDQALVDSDRLIAIYRRVEDGHRLGEAMALRANALHALGRAEESVGLLREALCHLDVRRDPHFSATAHAALAAAYDDLGRVDEALEHTRHARVLFEAVDHSEVALLRLALIEGEIAAKAGLSGRSEEALRRARDGFVRAGLAVDAAQATLSLAGLYFTDGKIEETARLAEEMLPIFQVAGLDQEATAALLLFREAALRRSLTETLLRQVSLAIASQP